MKKNVLFIIGDMKSGGAERILCNLCNELKADYNITLAVKKMKDADYIPSVNIITIPELDSRRKRIIGIMKLRKIKKEKNIHTSISFLMKNNIYNYYSKYKDKIIISNRNYLSFSKDTYAKKFWFFFNRIHNKADVVVNVSNAVRNDHINNHQGDSNKNIVIPNFCLIEEIEKYKNKKLSKEYQSIYNDKVIICPGRYSDQKGQWHLIKAFKKVTEKEKDARLVLIGRGPNKEEYEKLVQELHLENNIFILDFMKDIYTHMFHSKILVLNSFYEGMPNVVLEAMACSLPVIVSNSYGGAKEIIAPDREENYRPKKYTKEQYGILVPLCDKEKPMKEELTMEENELADAILLLLENKKEYNYFQKKSKERVQDYHKKKIIELWKRII